MVCQNQSIDESNAPLAKDLRILIRDKIKEGKNNDEIYKFLITPKNHRVELKNIKANFVYNFDRKVVNLNNIIIDNKNNKDVNATLKSLILKKNRLQNRVYLKSILNSALKFYAV